MKKIKQDVKVLEVIEKVIRSRGSLISLYLLWKHQYLRYSVMQKHIKASNGVYHPTLKRLINEGYLAKDPLNKLYMLTDKGKMIARLLFNVNKAFNPEVK